MLLTYILGGIGGIVVAVAWLKLCSGNPARSVGLIVFLSCFGEQIFEFAAARGVPPRVVLAGIASKDILSISLVAVLLLRPTPTRRRIPVAAGLVGAGLVFALGWVGSPLPVVARAESARGLAEPLLALSVGLLLTPVELGRARRIILRIIVLAASLSLVEYLIPFSVLDQVFNYANYYIAVKHQSGFLLNGVPGNFFTGTGFRRLGGTFGDPLSAGYLLGGSFALLPASRDRKTRASRGLLAIALCLTLTRAGWGIAVIIVAERWVRRASGVGARSRAMRRARAARPRISFSPAPMLVMAASGVALLLEWGKVMSVLAGKASSTKGHVAYLLKLFSGFGLAPHGLGTAGAVLASQPQYAPLVQTTESSARDVFIQLGLVGAVAMGLAILGSLYLPPGSEGYRVDRALLLGILLTSLISEELVTFNVGWCLSFLLIREEAQGISRGGGNAGQIRGLWEGSGCRTGYGPELLEVRGGARVGDRMGGRGVELVGVATQRGMYGRGR